MKTIKLLVCIFAIMLLCSCSKKSQIMDSARFDIYSQEMPIVTPLESSDDGYQIKPIEGHGKTRTYLSIRATSENGRYTTRGIVDWVWNIKIDDNVIISDNSLLITYEFPTETKTLNLSIKSKYDFDGNEIITTVIPDDHNTIFTPEEIVDLKSEMSKYIKDRFSIVGKKLKTGDVLKSTQIPGLENTDKNKINEIVKGVGYFKNRKVVVTEVSFDNSMDNKAEMTLRGSGYNLYDYETFISMHGEHSFRSTVRTDQLNMDMDIDAVSDTVEFEATAM